MAFTTEDLETRVRLYANEPDAADGGIPQADLLTLADDDLQSYTFPKVVAVREEYGVVVADTALVSGQAAYPVDPRAVANRLRDVLYVTTSGETRSLDLIEPEQLGTIYRIPQTGEPRGFYLQNGMLYAWPTPDTSDGYIRQKIFNRPGKLVPVTDCGQFVQVTTPANPLYWQVAFSTPYPTTWSTDNQTVDIIEGVGGFETKAYAATAVYVSGGTYQILKTSLLRTPVIGDWICLTGESCVPQIPDICHPWLARRTAFAVLETRQDKPGMTIAQAKSDEFESSVLATLKPRVDGEPRHITTPNSPYRSGGFGRIRYGRMP